MGIVWDGQTGNGRSVIALGMFDGVHIGHQVLLRRAKALARQQGVPLVVSTFTNHPMALIQPERCPPMLTTPAERARRMRAQGMDVLQERPFDRSVMDTPPEEFVADLCRRYHPLFIVVGFNHTFGRKGEGTPLLLTALGEVFGYRAEVVPKITLGGREVSSTVIRELLARGDTDLARQMLGQPYERSVLVGNRQGQETLLTYLDEGKQEVLPGQYRGLIQAGESVWPAALLCGDGGQIRARLARQFTPGSEAVIRYLHRFKNVGP
ncbi:MAG: FAD synthetase family protein [Clostridiales bacterium]|nr:FAD synthetase family protein [Clostridiales bacterium]